MDYFGEDLQRKLVSTFKAIRDKQHDLDDAHISRNIDSGAEFL